MISCTYNEKYSVYIVHSKELNKHFLCDKNGHEWCASNSDCMGFKKVDINNIPPIVLIKAFEYWNKPVEVRPYWLLSGNYPEAFMKAINDTWVLEHVLDNTVERCKTLPIGFYSIAHEEEKLIECLNFNLEDKGYISVVNNGADLQKVCDLLNSKTTELLSDYSQPYNHSYIPIDGGPLNGKCFIPYKNLIVSQYDCSILNLPKNKSVLEFNNDDGYEYWTLIVKYFEDYFQDSIILFSTKGDWDIKYLPDSNKYHLIEKNNGYKTENFVCNGTIDKCLDAQDLHRDAYQRGKQAGKMELANSIINTCENLVL